MWSMLAGYKIRHTGGARYRQNRQSGRGSARHSYPEEDAGRLYLYHGPARMGLP